MSGYFSLETGEELTDDELDTQYADWLDDIDGPIGVAGLTFDASRIIRELDPIAYRVGLSDYIDSELGETITDDAELAAEIRGESDED